MTRPEPPVLQRLRDPETKKATHKTVLVVKKRKIRDNQVSEAEKVFRR